MGHASIGIVEEQDIYSVIGEQGFSHLIAAFYAQVKDDEVLGPLYPKDDLSGAEQRLREFLIYRFGGPPRYIEKRGHPRLRMRHAPFPVDLAARHRWMELMRNALVATDIPSEAKDVLAAYFESTATAMMNR